MDNYDEVLERCPICGRTTKMTMYRDFLEEPLTAECICDCETDTRKSELQKLPIGECFHNIIRDRKFKEAVFERDDLQNARITDWCKQYVINFRRILKKRKNGILFIGDTGVGKSFFAACIGNALIDAGYTVLATTLPRLSADVGYNELNEKLQKLKQYQALIIDDWGVERKTEFMDEFLQTIVDERYRQQLPLILTSNRTVNQIVYPEDQTDHRIISRLVEMAEVVHVKGKDRRMKGIS